VSIRCPCFLTLSSAIVSAVATSFPLWGYARRLRLKVVPRSVRDEIVGWLGDSLKVKMKAPPEKGVANEGVVALLADRHGITASSIVVVSGHGSPATGVAVDVMNDEATPAAFPREKPWKSGDMGTREQVSCPVRESLQCPRHASEAVALARDAGRALPRHWH
jgi:uncharacterized protein